MSLLELEHVGKRYGAGGPGALEDVSMEMDAGEMVTIWGERRSGRSTLLRIAAGLETPDTGVVRVGGMALSERSGKALGGDVAYCRTTFRRSAGPTVLQQLMASQFARRTNRAIARSRACAALERVEAERCANVRPSDLKPDEVVRVSIARALTSDPRLLVVDEPTMGLDVLMRDGVLTLLRSLVDNEGIAVLTSTGDGTGVLGADRVLSLAAGELRGELRPDLAPVEDLSRHRQARG
jgi:ABC-type multidrug transport system ATPase subunit